MFAVNTGNPRFRSKKVFAYINSHCQLDISWKAAWTNLNQALQIIMIGPCCFSSLHRAGNKNLYKRPFLQQEHGLPLYSGFYGEHMLVLVRTEDGLCW